MTAVMDRPAVSNGNAETGDFKYVVLPLEMLEESPDNPRKHFEPVALQQLADSIREHGVLTPLIVRELGDGPHMIAAGHRRRRATEMAGRTEAPCLMREMSDVEFLELLTIDNLQRDDLHPMEEAQGFRTLMTGAGYDIPKIAARIGKSTKYVYDRVKLLQLIKPAQQMFLNNEFTAGHAILLARLTPKDQERAIGENDGRWGKLEGLFTAEYADDMLELGAKEEPRKPVSVREFQQWISDHVRFDPEKVDTPNLFPATAAALTEAGAHDMKVVKITRDYRVSDDAKDPKERTYGDGSWKRADGQTEKPPHGKAYVGKECEHAVLGVVVAGPGQGEAFKVCVAKKKCAVHWPAEVRAAKAAANGTAPAKKKKSHQPDNSYYEKQQAESDKRRAEGDRWLKARPALFEALAAKIAKAATGATSPLGQLVIAECKGYQRSVPKEIIPGKTADDLVRYVGCLILSGTMNDGWNAPAAVPAALKPFGIDAKAIVDEVAPKESKAEVQTVAKPKKAPKKKLAGDVRRAAAKKKGAKK